MFGLYRLSLVPFCSFCFSFPCPFLFLLFAEDQGGGTGRTRVWCTKDGQAVGQKLGETEGEGQGGGFED